MKRFYALTNHCHFNDLSYVIGVLLGDASVYRSHRGQIHPITGKICKIYTIELKVADRQFAETFASRLDHVIHRPNHRRWHVFPVTQFNNTYWRHVVRSSSFGAWWKSLGPESLCKYALNYPIDFLAGLYDSEGNLTMHKNGRWIREIRIFTVSTPTCDLACKAIRLLGLNAHYRVFRPKGTTVSLPSGKTTVSTKTLYVILPSPYRKFFEHVQSSIPRKNPPRL
jgi:hypothetical protein